MHLKKPAVVSVRVTGQTKAMIENVALEAGISYSDFVRMALVVGVRVQAMSMGINVELPSTTAHIVGARPVYRDEPTFEREHYYLSDGVIPDDIEDRMTAFIERLKAGKSSPLTMEGKTAV